MIELLLLSFPLIKGLDDYSKTKETQEEMAEKGTGRPPADHRNPRTMLQLEIGATHS